MLKIPFVVSIQNFIELLPWNKMEMVGEPSLDFIHYRMIGYRFLKALGNLDKKEEKKYCINFAFPPLFCLTIIVIFLSFGVQGHLFLPSSRR